MIISKSQKWILTIGIAVLIVAAIFFIPSYEGKEKTCAGSLEEITLEDSTEVKDIIYKYGIPIEEYNVNYGIVNPGQNLSFILSQYGLSGSDIHQLNENADTVFDVRKIRSGQAYAMFTSKDTVRAPKYFVYEADAKEYIIFRLTGDMKVSKGYNPVEWRTKEVKGQVESSLWVAMQNNNTPPQLAVVLSNIFGWSIDFFGLQKHDEYRVIYEQEYVDGKGLLNFNIRAASFRASDSLFYAIPFVQDGEELYYNSNGQSLEGAFLKAPLDFYRISSRFTNSRYHPVLKRYRAHHGVDYAAPTGTPVYAIGSGKVIAKGYQANGGGNYIKIRHNSTYTTSYMHLSRFAKGLAVGKMVKQKEIIGYVGSTGLSTGPHLDFRVFENGTPINPLTIKSQPKKPISKENQAEFQILCDSLTTRLGRM